MNVYDNIVSHFVLQYLLLDHIWSYWIPRFDSCWFHLVYLEFCFWAPTTLLNPYKMQHPSSIYLRTNSIQFQTCPWQHFAFCRQGSSVLYTNIYMYPRGVASTKCKWSINPHLFVSCTLVNQKEHHFVQGPVKHTVTNAIQNHDLGVGSKGYTGNIWQYIYLL